MGLRECGSLLATAVIFFGLTAESRSRQVSEEERGQPDFTNGKCMNDGSADQLDDGQKILPEIVQAASQILENSKFVVAQNENDKNLIEAFQNCVGSLSLVRDEAQLRAQLWETERKQKLYETTVASRFRGGKDARAVAQTASGGLETVNEDYDNDTWALLVLANGKGRAALLARKDSRPRPVPNPCERTCDDLYQKTRAWQASANSFDFKGFADQAVSFCKAPPSKGKSENLAFLETRIRILDRAATAAKRCHEEYDDIARKLAGGLGDADNDSYLPNHKDSGAPFVCPVANCQNIRSGFGMRMHPILGYRKMHNGIDLSYPYGTAVRAANSGVVGVAEYRGSAGNMVLINGLGPYSSKYMHLSRFAVREGDRVRAGQLIGWVGSTGRSTGPHLHFGTLFRGQYVNPLKYLYSGGSLANK